MALTDAAHHRSATVVALESAETMAVYYGEFERLRRAHPQVGEMLVAFLAGEVRRQNQLLLDALYVPAEQRVLRRLAELADTYAHDGVVGLTQEQLAQIAGTSRATVNRVLRAGGARSRSGAVRSWCSAVTRSAVSRR